MAACRSSAWPWGHDYTLPLRGSAWGRPRRQKNEYRTRRPAVADGGTEKLEEEREEERESEKETSKQAARNMLYYVLASIAHRAQEATCGRVPNDCGAARPRREEEGTGDQH